MKIYCKTIHYEKVIKFFTRVIGMYGNRIVIDSEIRYGKPTRGTRVPLDIILGSLSVGIGVEEVAEEYGMEKEGVLAAIEYSE